ncbi:MAG: pyridoxal phosphate-dependent aminotransferase [Thermodesulfobacteriota bacterium]|nr:pyridoxal phosphate-dependent aminotransferase [Thermodesulfobacteriota bacterium]
MISRRAQAITPFLVMDVLEKAKTMEADGIDVIHLEVGEPDFDVPPCVRDSMTAAMASGNTCYTHSLGDMRLREAISRHYRRRYGVDVPSSRIVVTAGTSPAMMLAFAALLDPEDEVILSDPHYACYPNFIRFVDGRVVTVPLSAAGGFQLNVEDAASAITEKTKAICINSPANPTGAVLSAECMASLAGLSPYIISDEVYHGLTYEGRDHSILEFTDHAFVLNGFSKLYAMTGLRLGYLIVPEDFVRTIQILHQNLLISANSVVQLAGITALEKAGDDVAKMREIYDQRRVYMLNRLRKMGFGIPVSPTGAFYVFADARHIDNDSYRLAFDILENARVGVAPGIDFGQNGEGYLRFSYANAMDNIEEGLNRVEAYLGRR